MNEIRHRSESKGGNGNLLLAVLSHQRHDDLISLHVTQPFLVLQVKVGEVSECIHTVVCDRMVGRPQLSQYCNYFLTATTRAEALSVLIMVQTQLPYLLIVICHLLDIHSYNIIIYTEYINNLT